MSPAVSVPLLLLVYLAVLFWGIAYARRRAGMPPEEEEEAVDPLRPSAPRAMLHAVGLCYDYLGLTVAGSVVNFFLGMTLILAVPGLKGSSPPLLHLLRLGALVVPLTLLMTGPAHLADLIGRREDPHALDLLRGWRRHGFRGFLLGLLNAVLFLVLAGDLLFFLSLSPPALRLVALPFGYLLLLWALAQPYLLPLLLRGFSPPRALRQGFLLTLGNPAFTGTVSFVIIAGVWLSVLAWIPMMLVTPVWACVTGAVATETLARKYDALNEIHAPQTDRKNL